jgi:hypothetical protein
MAEEKDASKEEKAWVKLTQAMREQFALRIPNLVNLSSGEARDTILAAGELMWICHHALSFDAQLGREDKEPWES